MTVTGVVRHVDLEGGAWLLMADDGRRFELVPAPEGVPSESRVEVDGELDAGVSMRMVGPSLRVRRLRRL